MPKGEFSRPFNKDLKVLQRSKLYKGSGLAGDASRALEEKRKWGARTPGNSVMVQREQERTTKQAVPSPVKERSRFNEKKSIFE